MTAKPMTALEAAKELSFAKLRIGELEAALNRIRDDLDGMDEPYAVGCARIANEIDDLLGARGGPDRMKPIRTHRRRAAEPLTEAGQMTWIEADKFIHTDYETVLLAVPNYEGTKVLHRLGMWDPENDQWTTFGASWHPQPTHVMELPKLPDVTAGVIASTARARRSL